MMRWKKVLSKNLTEGIYQNFLVNFPGKRSGTLQTPNKPQSVRNKIREVCRKRNKTTDIKMFTENSVQMAVMRRYVDGYPQNYRQTQPKKKIIESWLECLARSGA